MRPLGFAQDGKSHTFQDRPGLRRLGGPWHPSWMTAEFNPTKPGASGQHVGLLDESERGPSFRLMPP